MTQDYTPDYAAGYANGKTDAELSCSERHTDFGPGHHSWQTQAVEMLDLDMPNDVHTPDGAWAEIVHMVTSQADWDEEEAEGPADIVSYVRSVLNPKPDRDLLIRLTVHFLRAKGAQMWAHFNIDDEKHLIEAATWLVDECIKRDNFDPRPVIDAQNFSWPSVGAEDLIYLKDASGTKVSQVVWDGSQIYDGETGRILVKGVDFVISPRGVIQGIQE